MIVKFEAGHLFQIKLQDNQVSLKEYITPGLAKSLESVDMSFTLIHDGEVLGCGGIVEMWPNRAVVWSYIGRDAGKHFTEIHKATVRCLEVCPYQRIEATVQEGYEQGHRWIKMLGFSLETPEPMKKYNPDGKSAYLYAKVKD